MYHLRVFGVMPVLETERMSIAGWKEIKVS